MKQCGILSLIVLQDSHARNQDKIMRLTTKALQSSSAVDISRGNMENKY
jgi:hypothetical protein